MKLTINQLELKTFLDNGNKLIQKNNRLYMNGEVLRCKTLGSLMHKLYKKEWRENLINSVTIVK